mgnify:CR=1 FL=1
MANNKIRIRLKSFDHKILDASAEKIISSAKKSGAQVVGQYHYLLKRKYIQSLELFTNIKIHVNNLKSELTNV